MKYFILLMVFISSLYAQEDGYVLKQRAIMLSELEFKKNLDLINLDPETCKIPVARHKRIEVLKKNIKQLSTFGRFSHCQKFRFVGSRAITKSLRLQKKSVLQYFKHRIEKKKIIEKAVDPSVTNPDAIANVEDPEQIIEANDNTALPPDEALSNVPGTSIANAPIISGYVGVPYYVDPRYDETFGTKFSSQNFVFRSKDLPQGLHLHRDGRIIGLPLTAGIFNPEIGIHKFVYNMGVGHNYSAETVWKGPVKLNILPSPKFTVLNPSQRGIDNYNRKSFLTEEKPFLSVKIIAPSALDTVTALNGARKSKAYFEVKVHSISSYLYLGYALPGGWGKTLVRFSENESLAHFPIKKLSPGDVIMLALDSSSGKFWYGINGKWQPRKKASADSEKPDPEKGLSPLYDSQTDPGPKYNPELEYFPFMTANPETHVTFNFGDQPWKYPPPTGFSGVAFKPIETTYPNYWDVKTASEFAQVRFGVNYKLPRFLNAAVFNQALPYIWAPVTFDSEQTYLLDSRGDHILAKAPKSSGRWQFEVNIPDDVRSMAGIAPSNFDTKNSRLGAAGTRSVSVRLMDEVLSKTGKGVIEIDGKEHLIGPFDRTNRGSIRITFDCDFDTKKIKFYANSEFLLEADLPADVKEWSIAARSLRGSVYLSTMIDPEHTKDADQNGRDTHIGYMKYPVAGAKPWNIDLSRD